MSNHFYTSEPSAYPESWGRWPRDGAGDDYCGQCGCDQPDDPASHSMYCEFSDYDESEIPLMADTIAEQTGLDR